MNAYVPPRTFGDLLASRGYVSNERCTFCKLLGVGRHKYSTRHYICAPCIEPRRDVVLPAIVRRERFNRQMAALR